MTFDKWWDSYDNFQCDKDSCEDAYVGGQDSKQCEIDKLTRQIELMKGWEKIAQSNGEDKRKYLKRITNAIKYIEDYYGCVELSNITDILTGEVEND